DTETAKRSVSAVLKELAGGELVRLYLGGDGGGVALLDRGQHVRQQLVEALTHDLPVGVVGGHVPPAGEGSPSHVATLVVADAAYELPHAGEDVAHGAHVVPRVVTGQRE